MTILDIQNVFDTDSKCREVLCRLRWPNGPECPRCHGKAVELETVKQLFYCKECDYQFTVTAGTIFNDSHLPLNTWFTAVLLLVEARKGFSANQMKRTIGVSYKTAWYLCHRIRAAMKEAGRPMLDGTVEMDETYVGGKHKTIRHRDKVYVDGDIHTNTVESAFSLLKRGIMGTWHKISAKHLQAYLDEMSFRFDRRKNHDLFLDTLRHMITAPVLTFEKLTA